MKLFRKKPPPTKPTPPKPMVAKFTVHMRNGTDIYHSEHYDGAHMWNKPHPHMWDGWVSLGNVWINRDDVIYISVEHVEVRDEIRNVM